MAEQQYTQKTISVINNATNIAKDRHHPSVDVPHLLRALFDEDDSFVHSPVTSGTGLKTALVAAASEGYAKDQLDLALLASEGKISSDGGFLPIEYTLGQQFVEIGAYAEAGDLLIPKSCFDWNKDANGPYYYTNLTGTFGGISASDFRITRFGWNAIQATVSTGMTHFTNQKGSNKSPAKDKVGRGPYQLTGKKPKDVPVSSEFSPAGGRPFSTGGDVYFHPDNLLWECNMLETMVSYSKLSMEEVKSDSAVANLLACCGQQSTSKAGLKCFFGGNAYGLEVSLGSMVSVGSEEFKSMELKHLEEVKKVLLRCSDAVMGSGKPAHYAKLLKSDPGHSERLFLIATLEDDGWFINQYAYGFLKNLKDYQKSACLDFWELLYGTDVTWNELLKKFEAKISTCSQAINKRNGTNYTYSDVGDSYGAASDDFIETYEWGDYNHRGAVFYVDKERSSVYNVKYKDGSDPFSMILFNILLMRNFASTFICGKVIYGSLAQVACVGVDVSKPETYIEGLEDGTFKPAGSLPFGEQELQSGYDEESLNNLDWIKTEFSGAKTRGLTEGTTGSVQRRQYLAIAYARTLGSDMLYSQNSIKRLTTKYSDCSSFVEKCLHQLTNGSFQVDGARDTIEIYNNAVESGGTYQIVTVGSITEAKSGDLLWYKKANGVRHIVVIVGFNEKIGKLLVSQASNDFDSTPLDRQVVTDYYGITISEINRKLIKSFPDKAENVELDSMCVIRPRIFNTE